MTFEKKDIPKKSDGLSSWYNKVVIQAELADYGPAKGTMIFRPYGYGLWENTQRVVDDAIKQRGIANAYFPMFIPESLINKEKSHVEGFSPELAVVTIGGGEELTEKLVLRPTSETIIYDSFAKWIESWRDLPMQINQWSNAIRWEKRTYLFLRTSEFLWQEGHTAHATHDESLATVHWAMDMYEKTYREYLAIPGFVGRKSDSEKFAGADMTLTYETLMPEGKALQSCTSHDLGQNFAKAFDIGFLDAAGTKQLVWQTSWGLSTRAIGAVLMAHGDDQGLRLPPRIAPIQVAVVLVGKLTDELTHFAVKTVDALAESGVRVVLDDDESESMGRKINKWELKGVPLRIEIGPREAAAGEATIVRRDTFEKYEQVAADQLGEKVVALLDKIQQNLLHEAEQFLKENTHDVTNYTDFKKIMSSTKGFIRAFWCEDAACEAAIKDETSATTRCLPSDAPSGEGVCILCQKPASNRWLFAQSY